MFPMIDTLVKNSTAFDHIVKKGYTPLFVLREHLKSFELPKV